MKLNAKQKRFIEEYLIDLNATEACIRAGYAPSGANTQGPRLMQNPKVMAEIDKRIEKRSERTEITQDMVVQELAKIGFANMADYMRPGPDGDPYLDFSQLSRDQAAALIEVTVEDFKDGRGEDTRDVRKIKFKLADKKGALVDLGKHIGMWPNNAKLDVKVIYDDRPDDELDAELARAAEEAGVSPEQLAAMMESQDGPQH